MKIVYSAPNRSHHYPYAEAIYRANNLKTFISGYSRFSKKADSEIKKELKRYDLFQNLFLASLKLNSPYTVSRFFTRASARWIDQNSYQWAKDADAFIFYRTHGYRTMKKLHRNKKATLCIMEEVNSHVETMTHLLREEFSMLGLGKYDNRIPDYDLRLKAYEEADYILCPSEFVRRSFIEKGFDENKIIKNVFGFPKPSAPLLRIKKEKDAFRVLYVGQIHYRKGLRYALEAFRRLKHPNKEFIIVGPKTQQTGLENIAIPDKVSFLGVLKGEELRRQYASANIFVLPSIEEGLALVQSEALIEGLPLLITTNTGGEDIIQNGKEGFIVPPANINALAERMELMAENHGLLESMSFEAANTARSLWSWDDAAENLCNEIIKRI